MNNRNCLQCGKALLGRMDKRYCDDYCRTMYNNQHAANNDAIRIVNRLLRHNRGVIERILGPERKDIHISPIHLVNQGYHFNYHTHVYAEQGQEYVCCYDYGFCRLAEDRLILFRQSEMLK